MIINIKNEVDAYKAEMFCKHILEAVDEYKELDVEESEDERLDEQTVIQIEKAYGMTKSIRKEAKYPSYIVVI